MRPLQRIVAGMASRTPALLTPDDEPGEPQGCIVDLSGATEDERTTRLQIKRRIDPLLHGDARPLTMTEGGTVVRQTLQECRQRRAGVNMVERTDPEFERMMARIGALTRRLAEDSGEMEIESLLSLADEYEQVSDYLECRIDDKPYYEEVAEATRAVAKTLREQFDGTAVEGSAPCDSNPPWGLLH